MRVKLLGTWQVWICRSCSSTKQRLFPGGFTMTAFAAFYYARCSRLADQHFTITFRTHPMSPLMEHSARTRQQTLLMKRIHCLAENIDWKPKYCNDSVTRPTCSYWIHVCVCVCVCMYRVEKNLRKSSPWLESLLRNKLTMLYYTYAETPSLRGTHRRQMG
jgi:hypothetical protein